MEDNKNIITPTSQTPQDASSQPQVTPPNSQQPSTSPEQKPATPPSPPPSSDGTPTPPSPKVSKKLPKPGLIFGAVFAIAALVAVYVFAFYLPNTPENVYSSGLNNSGKALEMLLNSLADEERIETFSKSQVIITADADWADYDFEGSLDSKFNKTDSNSNLQIDATGGGENFKFNLDVITKLPEDSYFPNVFFRLSGLDDVAQNTAYSDYTKLIEDKWIRMSSDYLNDTLGDYYDTENPEEREQVTNEDVAKYIEVTSAITREYVFTDNPDKAVITNKGFVAEEETEGVTAYKYDATVNKENTQKYCVAITNAVVDLEITKKLSGMTNEEINERKEETEEDCQDSVDDIEDDFMFHLWVNKRTKLIHKARFYSSQQDKTSYVDVGQKFDGGDTIEFFSSFVDESESTTVDTTLSLNTDTLSSKGTLTAKQTKDNGYNLNATLEIKPFESDIEANEPSDYTDIEDILSQLGFGQSSAGSIRSSNSGGSVSDKAADTEITTDINAIRGHLEAHYADNGYYPTLSQLNSTSYRQDNMPGLDEEALISPLDGTNNPRLSSTATTTSYGYSPSECSGSECQSYVLEGVYADGTAYTKKSLN